MQMLYIVLLGRRMVNSFAKHCDELWQDGEWGYIPLDCWKDQPHMQRQGENMMMVPYDIKNIILAGTNYSNHIILATCLTQQRPQQLRLWPLPLRALCRCQQAPCRNHPLPDRCPSIHHQDPTKAYGGSRYWWCIYSSKFLNLKKSIWVKQPLSSHVPCPSSCILSPFSVSHPNFSEMINLASSSLWTGLIRVSPREAAHSKLLSIIFLSFWGKRIYIYILAI